MGMFSIKVNRLNDLQLKFKHFAEAPPKAVRAAFYEIGKDLVKDMQSYIDEPKSGRVYGTKFGVSKFRKAQVTPRILNKSRAHIASAPGQAPAKWTGKLRKSLDFQVIGATEQSLMFGVNQSRWGCDYAQYLEHKDLLGMTGQRSKRIAPRPFVSRAYAENKQKIIERMNYAIQQAIQK
jgi:hypothetical protein